VQSNHLHPLEELHFNIQHTVDGKLKDTLKKIWWLDLLCTLTWKTQWPPHWRIFM